MKTLFGLSPAEIDQITGVLAREPGVMRGIVFGSRALGTQKLGSDIDIALQGTVDLSVCARVKGALEDGTIMPYFFDVIAYDDIQNAALRAHIDDHGAVIFQRAAVRA